MKMTTLTSIHSTKESLDVRHNIQILEVQELDSENLTSTALVNA
jgi:hypothetical protein